MRVRSLVHRVTAMDPFATLGIAPRFSLDLRAVETRHRELSRALHPDKHLAATGAERREALSRAIEVNEAFRVVRDPVRRAEALLTLAGVAVGETREPKPDPSFLMEVLEDREALEEAKKAGDRASVAQVKGRADALFAAAERALSASLDAGDHAAALPLLGKLRYAARFVDEARRADEALESN